MEQSRAYLLQRFRRLGALYIYGCALTVVVLVVLGVRQVQITTYGRMVGSGLNGIAGASMGESEGFSDAEVLTDFRRNFEALVDQGSFHCITLVSPDGELLVSTDQGPCELLDSGLRKLDSVLAKNTIVTSIESSKDSELLVVAPLRRTPEEEPYGVVIAARPYSLIQASMFGVSAAIAATILLGATAAYTLLSIFVRRAEQEIDRQARLVQALNRRLSGSLHEAEEHTVGTLKALVAAVDAKDSYTAQHSLNVADYACAIALITGHEESVLQLERAGLLHDVGKIGISEQILSKPGPLTGDEFAAVKEHSSSGAGIITTIPFLKDVVPIVKHHHEHVDGSGYPDGLIGEEIPLLARILAVADAFDAMTTERPYQRAMSTQDALDTLVANRGTQFDPHIVDAFVEAVNIGEIRVRGSAA